MFDRSSWYDRLSIVHSILIEDLVEAGGYTSGSAGGLCGLKQGPLACWCAQQQHHALCCSPVACSTLSCVLLQGLPHLLSLLSTCHHSSRTYSTCHHSSRHSCGVCSSYRYSLRVWRHSFSVSPPAVTPQGFNLFHVSKGEVYVYNTSSFHVTIMPWACPVIDSYFYSKIIITIINTAHNNMIFSFWSNLIIKEVNGRSSFDRSGQLLMLMCSVQ